MLLSTLYYHIYIYKAVLSTRMVHHYCFFFFVLDVKITHGKVPQVKCDKMYKYGGMISPPNFR